MPAYDSNLFNPPAPLARVSLRTPHNSNIVSDVPILIDSGSDLTLIPERSIEELNLDLDQNESYELTGFDGYKSLAKSVQLDLVFLSRTFKGRFVVVSSEIGILGRNVLNRFALLLDGPGLGWELKDSGK
jgi:hypothetical protein